MSYTKFQTSTLENAFIEKKYVNGKERAVVISFKMDFIILTV